MIDPEIIAQERQEARRTRSSLPLGQQAHPLPEARKRAHASPYRARQFLALHRSDRWSIERIAEHFGVPDHGVVDAIAAELASETPSSSKIPPGIPA